MSDKITCRMRPTQGREHIIFQGDNIVGIVCVHIGAYFCIFNCIVDCLQSTSQPFIRMRFYKGVNEDIVSTPWTYIYNVHGAL